MRSLRLAAKRAIAGATSSPLNLAIALGIAFAVGTVLLAVYIWVGGRVLREKLSSGCQNKCNTCTRCQRNTGKPCKKKCQACTQCKNNENKNKPNKQQQQQQQGNNNRRRLLSEADGGGGGGGWRPVNLTVYKQSEHNGKTDVAMAPYKWDVNDNFAAVHTADFNQWKGKTVEIKWGNKQFKVKIVDSCADTDCSDGSCCTTNRNKNSAGFLLDLYYRTANKYGVPFDVTPALFREV